MLLLIDNYDSFVHNLARYLRQLGQETVVVRNDAIHAADIHQLQPSAIVLSPGPCGPAQAGCTLDVVRQFATSIPMLGVCLGHQTIAAAYGADVVASPRPAHGTSSQIQHDGTGVFAGLPSPFRVGRYHSLVVDEETLPDCLRVNARLTDGTVMGFEHRTDPVVGLQFHPESVLTEHGYELLGAFLRNAGVPLAGTSPQQVPSPSAVHEDWFQRDVEHSAAGSRFSQAESPLKTRVAAGVRGNLDASN